MKNNFEKKIKKNLTINNFNISQQHVTETIEKSKEEYLRSKSKGRIGFLDFLKLQIKYVGTYTWLIQGIFTILAYMFMKVMLNNAKESLYISRGLIILLVNISLITAVGNMFFIAYSQKNNMMELENSTYMSISKIIVSRFIILSLGNLVTFISILVQLISKTNIIVYFGIVLLVFPYLLISCGNNLLINMSKKISNNILIIYNLIIFILLNILIYFITNYISIVRFLGFFTIILGIIYIFQIRNIYFGNFKTEETV